jgi:hypothetical protein
MTQRELSRQMRGKNLRVDLGVDSTITVYRSEWVDILDRAKALLVLRYGLRTWGKREERRPIARR